MSNVVPLGRPPFAHVEIERLRRKEEGVTLPMPKYFVTYVDEDGGRLFGVSESALYSEALADAEEWGLPVVDKTRAAT